MVAVLGHFPEYLRVGTELAATVFDVDDDIWETMTDSERWDANRTFLDDIIARGDRIMLATPPEAIKRPSYLAMEPEYLISKGFALRRMGTMWEVTR